MLPKKQRSEHKPWASAWRITTALRVNEQLLSKPQQLFLLEGFVILKLCILHEDAYSIDAMISLA